MKQGIIETPFNYNYIVSCNAFYTKSAGFFKFITTDVLMFNEFLYSEKDLAIHCLALKSLLFVTLKIVISWQ